MNKVLRNLLVSMVDKYIRINLVNIYWLFMLLDIENGNVVL